MSKKGRAKHRKTRVPRRQRLREGRRRLKGYTGDRPIQTYARWFHLDLATALGDVRKMGVRIPAANLEQVIETLRERSGSAPRPRGRKAEASPGGESFGVDFDDNFAFIAGHTSGGAPFGVTWDEMDEVEGVEGVDGMDEMDGADEMDEMDEEGGALRRDEGRDGRGGRGEPARG